APHREMPDFPARTAALPTRSAPAAAPPEPSSTRAAPHGLDCRWAAAAAAASPPARRRCAPPRSAGSHARRPHLVSVQMPCPIQFSLGPLNVQASPPGIVLNRCRLNVSFARCPPLTTNPTSPSPTSKTDPPHLLRQFPP